MVVLALCAAALVAVSLRRIPEGQAYTLRRIGGHMRTLGAGMHLVLPLLERVQHKISLLGEVVETGDLPLAQADRPLRGKVYVQVLDAQRADPIIDQMGQLVRQQLPELVASAIPDEDACARNARLKAGLNQRLRDRGLLITRVQLD